MGLFGKKKKQKIQPQNPNLEKSIVESIAADNDTERAVITYILLQAEKNNIYLGKKGDITYISFKNEKISSFLNEWYTILRLKQGNGISDKTYKVFVTNELMENRIGSTEAKTDKNEDTNDLIDDIL